MFLIAKFHRTDFLVVCSHSREGKPLSYSRINTVIKYCLVTTERYEFSLGLHLKFQHVQNSKLLVINYDVLWSVPFKRQKADDKIYNFKIIKKKKKNALSKILHIENS